jgi:hypothetical protein
VIKKHSENGASAQHIKLGHVLLKQMSSTGLRHWLDH